jgi:hypothetical protein
MAYQIEAGDDGVEEKKNVVSAQEIRDSPTSLRSGVDENPSHVHGTRIERVNNLTKNDSVSEDGNLIQTMLQTMS